MDELKKRLIERIAQVTGLPVEKIKLERPELEQFGDYMTNAALIAKGGRSMAEKIAENLSQEDGVLKAEVAGPGFVNISIRTDCLIKEIVRVLDQAQSSQFIVHSKDSSVIGKKIMVEYAHPNTHKELHIGHMRTLVTGEALARILEAAGAKVFRANYQGDIGPHVAKAIWGTRKIMAERKLDWEEAEKMNAEEKAHLLGEGYVEGNKYYEDKKAEIDQLNRDIYDQKDTVWKDYQRTRRWSLEYYDTFYSRFGSKFDKLFFESEVADLGKKIVEEHEGEAFTRSQGALVFEGEKYGLHTRVFVTAQGTPTYEGKEMGLAYKQYETFPFERVIHVVANEQAGYFKVVIKALEELDDKFKDREVHLSMGMIQLVGQKMSSRTGIILRVDQLLEQIKAKALELNQDKGIAEMVTMGAVKYSILKVDPVADVAFDIEQSVSLEGNSGPYLQYTYARTQSVLKKSQFSILNFQSNINFQNLNEEEMSILRWLGRFEETIVEAADKYKPSILTTYLYELAQRFNSFYNKHSILNCDNTETREFRTALTAATGQIIKEGLHLLGIEAPERM